MDIPEAGWSSQLTQNHQNRLSQVGNSRQWSGDERLHGYNRQELALFPASTPDFVACSVQAKTVWR